MTESQLQAQVKRCPCCKETKAVLHFHRRGGSRGEQPQSYCKNCLRTMKRRCRKAGRYRKQEREYAKRYWRSEDRLVRRLYATSETGKRILRASNARYRQKFPGKAKAHMVVSNAIQSGRLQRQPCERCQDSFAHAHHPDYRRPLFIQWLCHNCHYEEHDRKRFA